MEQLSTKQVNHTKSKQVYAYTTLVHYTFVRSTLIGQPRTKELMEKIKELDFIIDEVSIYLLENDKLFVC